MNDNPTNADEQYALGISYHFGTSDVPKDMEKAVYWYTKAAEQGHALAQNDLGNRYQIGEGVPKNSEKMAYWYTKAAEQGVPQAQYNIGVLYSRGEGVPQDKEKAADWYTKAAEQGDADAQYNLGILYFRGEGVSQDTSEAKNWFAKAAAQGNANAKEALNKFDKGGCYVATCVYGSYNCPEVWTLRRYRDRKLSASWFGRRFIQIYYTVSPKIVELFGSKKWFNGLWKPVLNQFVRKLQNSGIDNSHYKDIP